MYFLSGCRDNIDFISLQALLAFLLFIIGRYAAPSRTETLREMVVPVHRYFGIPFPLH